MAQTRNGDDDRRGDGARILDGRTLRDAHRPWILDAHASWDDAQGLCWYTERRDGIEWSGHAGSVDGFNSKVHISLADGLGVIVLLNAVGPAWTLAAELGAIAMTAHRAAAAATRPAPAPADVPAHWRSLLGIYRFAGYGPGNLVEIRGGKLMLRDEDGEAEGDVLAATDDPYRFVISGGRPAGEDALFLRAADGTVDAANIGGYPMERWIPATRGTDRPG